MMKRKGYIFCLYLAMLIVLSTNMLAHHHHFNNLCFDVEICSIDGNINDAHTSDPCQNNSSDDTCEIEQMRTFLTSAKSVQQLQQSISAQSHLLYTVVPEFLYLLHDTEKHTTTFHDFIILIPEKYVFSGGLRAPPTHCKQC